MRREIANQVKVNVTKMEDLHLISGTHMVEGKRGDCFDKLSSAFHMHIMACLCPHTHRHSHTETNTHINASGHITKRAAMGCSMHNIYTGCLAPGL